MATRAATVEPLVDGNPNCFRVIWTGLLNGDDGSPVELPECPDKTVHFSGTFGAGGSIQLEGSNMKTSETPTYVLLTDPQGNNIVKTAEAMETIEEAPLLVRPRVTAGDGTTSLTVRMLVRRPRA